MLEANVQLLLQRLQPDDLVLDVGGWACPFNRAQWVLDAQPFDTRGFYATFGGLRSHGGDREWFTRETWVVRDICDHTPWPFSDKHFDFAVCSQTLEDVRDPIWVCHELIRVAKAGYIEVPSRAFESCLGVERPGQAGLSHHRWLIETSGNSLTFLQKYHMIHTDWLFALPPRYGARLKDEAAVSSLWWHDSFSYSEMVIHGVAAQEGELRRFAQSVCPAPRWLLRGDSLRRRVLSFSRRGVSWLRRKVSSSVG
jgi:hypothetical protein